MKPREVLELVFLAALWGGSFLFMRLAADDFPPVVMAFLRVFLAACALLPILVCRRQWPALRQHWRTIGFVGLINSALPFLAYAYAASAITAGLASIFNATTPLMGAVVAWLWLGNKPTPRRALGLAIGLGGVMWLAWDNASFKPGAAGPLGAVLACLAATLCYGVSANFTQRFLTGVPPLAMAAGSQLSATLVLLLPALWWWPQRSPSATAWASIVCLALLCTGLAYLLFFRLIAKVGPAKAMSVTFLIPAFAVLWGALFLAERLTPVMGAACAAILLGTALVTGLIKPAPGDARSENR